MCAAAWLGGVIAAGGCSSGESTQADAGYQEPILDAGVLTQEAAVPPNGKALCTQGPCNFQTNEGCAANQTCAPFSPDAKTPVCVAAGTTALSGACMPGTDCGPGSVCAGGFCRKLCCAGDWTGCTQGEHCIGNLFVPINGQPTDTGVFLCLPVNYCSALDPGSCAAMEPGKTCQIVDPTGATACVNEGTGEAGQACPCKGGFTCVTSCRRLCKAVAGGGEPSCPPSEGRCVHFIRDPDGVGECTPP
jgi:hypothetical protein